MAAGTTQVNAQADLLGYQSTRQPAVPGSNLPQDLADQIAAALGQAKSAPQLVIDSGALRNAVERIAAGVARLPRPSAAWATWSSPPSMA